MKAFRMMIPLLLITLTTGCSSAWWQTVVDNPAMSVTSLATEVHTLLDTAAVLYTAVSEFLPAEKRTETDKAYKVAVIGITHALTVLEDAAQVAQETHNDHPDLTKEISGVVAAIRDLSAIIDLFRSVGTSKAVGAQQNAITGMLLDYQRQETVVLRHAHH